MRRASGAPTPAPGADAPDVTRPRCTRRACRRKANCPGALPGPPRTDAERHTQKARDIQARSSPAHRHTKLAQCISPRAATPGAAHRRARFITSEAITEAPRAKRGEGTGCTEPGPSATTARGPAGSTIEPAIPEARERSAVRAAPPADRRPRGSRPTLRPSKTLRPYATARTTGTAPAARRRRHV